MAVQVRRVRSGEGERLREVRLRALADAPHAFGRSFDEDAAHTEAWWAGLAADERVLVAEDVASGTWAGMAGGRLLGGGGVAELWGMWVEPAARGTGVAERLVDAVAGWAREQGASRLELQVAEANGPAARFYTRVGFKDTGRRPDGGCKLRLCRDL